MSQILIVDDDATNRELLGAFLEGTGHTLSSADSGEGALAMAEETPPDLVLLDVMMPGIDGFETARRFKARSRDGFLPVVLLTALADSASRVTGLRAGADDFLTKPIEQFELLARINNLLSLRAKDLALLQRNVELAELHRFKDEMIALLVHDLKNPISVIMANLDYMASQLRAASPLSAALGDSREASRRMTRLIANLLDVTRLEASRLEIQRAPVVLADLLRHLVRQRRPLMKERGIQMVLDVAEDVTVSADTDLLSRTLENVIDNSLRYTPRDGSIEVSVKGQAERAIIRIGNTGPPVPLGERDRIFEKYGQAEGTNGRMNHGLGLYFCRLVAEAHRGRIWVEETPKLPALFTLELPT